MKIHSLTVFYKCTKVSSAGLQESDPFRIQNFVVVVSWVPEYVHIVDLLGTFWVGLKLKYPLIWLPLDEYQP